jgi:hypothetical protein
MSQVQNLPVPLKTVDTFIASMDPGTTPEMQALAARELIAALKEARKVLEEGFNRKELTVCNGKLGYVDPKDAARFLSGEIPRLTVYRKQKDAHNMGLFYKRPPKFFREHKRCKATPQRTASTTTATSKRPAKRSALSTRKPTKS